jgi:hypothetical protein
VDVAVGELKLELQDELVGTIASRRLRNSGVNIFLTASSCASSRLDAPKPMLSRAMSIAPALVVMIRIVLRKSTVLPW